MYQVLQVSPGGSEYVNLIGTLAECEGFVRAQQQFCEQGWRLVVRPLAYN